MKKDILGLLLLGGLGIGAYFLLNRSNQADQTGGGGGGAQQGALPAQFITNIYNTFNYRQQAYTAPPTGSAEKGAVYGSHEISKTLFRPYGGKTVTGEIARYTVEKYNVLPGVLHELYLKETQRKFPGWAIWKAR